MIHELDSHMQEERVVLILVLAEGGQYSLREDIIYL